ncbi:MAG: hypothetical protein GC168_12155 [Candidatus Hydrogenedens sp.]|nr:hypothetical protein [Candidatus Hydrogenedens sp.]
MLLVLTPLAWGDEVIPLPRAHSHNDYNRDRPLLDALDHGMCSVEADIFLVDGALLVGHNAEDLTPERSLEKLYLDPLQERVQANSGKVFPGGPCITLLIDIKDDGRKTYARLREVLTHYKDMLTEFTDDATTERAVTVILSGARPEEMVAAESTRLVALDGRLDDLDNHPNPHLYPLVSESWLSVFKWMGAGEMPAEERAKLDELVAKAHANGQRIRFWALPFGLAAWDTAYEAGVDYINVDFPERVQKFMLEKMGKTAGE